MQDGTKYLVLTREEAELLLDSFKVTHPLTRTLVLKAASLVREWAATEDLAAVERILRTRRRRTTSE
jgi:hypothetical protein